MSLMSRLIMLVLCFGFAWLGLTFPVVAAQPSATSWTAEKCVRYKDAWSAYIRRAGTSGLSPDFIAAHQAFIDSGCLQGRNVCPKSPEEFNAANAMTIRAMNAGTASTFLPFACRR